MEIQLAQRELTRQSGLRSISKFIRYAVYNTERKVQVGDYHTVKSEAEKLCGADERVVGVALDRHGRPLFTCPVDYDKNKFKSMDSKMLRLEA